LAMKKVRIAIIGCGMISSYHIEALRLIPQADIVACCDIVKERAVKAAQGDADCYTDYREVLQRKDIDLAVILTPNDLHYEMTVAFTGSGVNCLVQKPMARSAEECSRMIQTAEENQVKLFVSFMHRYFEETQWAKQYIESGALGEIYLCRIRNSLPGSDYSCWQYEAERCGPGGAIIDVGVHGIDVLRYLLGDFDSVLTANKGRKRDAREICGQTIYPDNEDWALVAYRMKNGAMVSHEISWIQKWHCNRFCMEIHGSEGSIYIRTPYGPLAVSGMAGTEKGALSFPPLNVVPFGYRQHKNIIDAIINDTDPVCGGYDGLRTIEIVEAILRTANNLDY
jgi:UDP-N-acetyl-2-amino-2-deoxyglucuronate dehydrogenase